jgi:hypothetical protein
MQHRMWRYESKVPEEEPKRPVSQPGQVVGRAGLTPLLVVLSNGVPSPGQHHQQHSAQCATQHAITRVHHNSPVGLRQSPWPCSRSDATASAAAHSHTLEPYYVYPTPKHDVPVSVRRWPWPCTRSSCCSGKHCQSTTKVKLQPKSTFGRWP